MIECEGFGFPVPLIALAGFVIGDALAIVVNDAFLILGTARRAGIQVRRAPVVGHVVQT